MSVFNEEYQFDSNYRIFTNLHRPRTIISSVVESGRSATSLVLLSRKMPGGRRHYGGHSNAFECLDVQFNNNHI
jgi:hypothetical protein